MTITFGRDGNNDLYIGNDGDVAIYNQIEAVAAASETAVKALLGEMIFAVDTGMPNFQTIWNGVPNIPQYEAYLRSTIIGVDGVSDIIDLKSSVVGDVLMYSATIKTIYGETSINA